MPKSTSGEADERYAPGERNRTSRPLG
jgi:hypothetical protein